MAHKRMLSIRKPSVIILLNLVLVIILFLIVEGLSNSIIIARYAFTQDLIAERQHTQYDEEIGWINLPNLFIKDMYGGKSFITNSMAFRNDKEFSFSVPNNKVRVICSGDSFTMGYGVGNDDVWCKRLESIDNQLETVNLGQGGYGVDQAYLWYRRNSVNLDHDIHLFAFITGDFYRMQRNTFLGYGKPFFVVQDNALININKPVPKLSYLIPRLPVMQRALSKLSSSRILKKFLFQKDPSLSLEKQIRKDNQTQEVVVKIIEALQKISKHKNSSLVLVHLPIKSDYMDNKSEKWRSFIHAEAAKHNFLLIDLFDEFRKYPPQEVGNLFDGHYSAEGNLYIAKILYEKLLSIPEIANKFPEK